MATPADKLFEDIPEQSETQTADDLFKDIPSGGQALGGKLSDVQGQTKSLEERGINTAGAPIPARALATLGVRGKEGLEQGLSAYFKTDIKVEKDEETGLFLYQDPQTKQKTVIDPAGGDLGDFVDILQDAAVLIPEIGGAIVGASGGSTGATAGGAGGALLGEAGRLLLGRKKGVNNLTDTEIAMKALGISGISLAGGAAGQAVVSLVRGMARVMGSRVGSISPQEGQILKSKIKETEGVLDPINEATGRNARFNATQATQDPIVAREMQAFSGSSDETFRAFEAQDRELQETLLEFYDETAKKALNEQATDPFATGAKIQTEIVERRARRETLMDQKVSEAERSVDETIESISPNERVLKDIGAGQKLRESFKQEIKNSKEAISTSHDRLIRIAEREFGERAKVPTEDFRPIIAKNLEEAAVEIDSRATNNILRNLNPEDRDVAGKVMEALVERGSSSTKFGNLTFAEAAETSSFLKALSRKIDNGLETNVDQGAVKKLISALDKDIGESLKAFPDTAIAYDAFRNLVRTEKDRLQRNAVAAIIRENRSGAPEVLDEKVLDEAFKTKEGALRMGEILRQDRSLLDAETRKLYDEGLEIFRNGVRQKYLDKVVSNGKVNIKAHRKFLSENEDVLNALFDPKDVQKFKNPGFMQERMETLVRARRDLHKKLKNSPINRIVKNEKDPNQIFNRLWNEGQPTDLRILKRNLRETPELWEEFKATAQSEMRRKLMTRKNNQDILSFEELGKLLNEKSQQLSEIYGKEYVANLRKLEVALRRANEPVKAASTDKEVSSLIDLARVYARPLSARGKVFTAGLKIRRKRFNRMMAETMTDPEKLKKLITLNQISRGSDTAASVLAQLGAYSLVPNNFSEEEREGINIGEVINQSLPTMMGAP